VNIHPQDHRVKHTDSLFSDIIKIIIAILLPPLGVFLERGCGADLLINILLTILGYIPGIIHALYVYPSFRVEESRLTDCSYIILKY